MGAWKVRGHGVAVHSLEDSRGVVLSLYGKLEKIFLNNNRNTLVIKFEKHNSKNRRRVGRRNLSLYGLNGSHKTYSFR